MNRFLDSERLNGPHAARISARPMRIAIPVNTSDSSQFRAAIDLECQLWGGAANVILPIGDSGRVPELYRSILPGSQIDRINGMGYDPEMAIEESPRVGGFRDVSRSQLAVGLLNYREQGKVAPLQIVDLSDGDPWRDIYAACLGSLPAQINQEIIRSGNWLPELDFSDFLEVRREATPGSLEDLLARTWSREPLITPRKLSMTKLSYAGTASSSLRSGKAVLPDPRAARLDAGPNVLVICTPGAMEDLALLWNLRAAHGDFYATPLGVPSTALSGESIQKVLMASGLARNGVAVSSLYVTSASIDANVLQEMIGNASQVAVRPPSEMLMFGTVLGMSRDEILMWKDGRASYKPLDQSSYQDVVKARNINDLLMMQYDVSVEDAPLPLSGDYRVDPLNGAFYNDSHTVWSSPAAGLTISAVEWPSRGLIASSLASVRGIELRESAPGIAARILVDMLGDLHDVYLLCHEPLLKLLESMAARQGFNWYKERLRQAGVNAHDAVAVGQSVDDLPEKSFHDFKRALRNNEAATKFWLVWAERSSVVIKGFSVQCPRCGAKQWIPVGNFAPPIVCRGCTEAIEYPFGDRPVIDFKYRLSEQVRRVYESDAMGHVLAARFFTSIFDFGTRSQLIGMHPGMSVSHLEVSNEIGEADLLMLTRWGEFVPIEVKRTASGLTGAELEKLATLSSALQSPWSGVASCEYAVDAELTQGTSLSVRNSDGTYARVALSYDHMLDAHPMWALGDDPFEQAPLSRDDIAAREEKFVAFLVARAKESNFDWLAYSMLRRRAKGESGSGPEARE
ncbi:hypothetical protein NY542_00175 [Curtobacterium flaccumfaciens pv. betae]|uniref:hypothetical protein n=1 Tax=Curtobacterium flaccumfaciens TaxID=2035 RepID=UPI001BDF6E1A|nr:hypothetical protein [Curtobacterium flaccumfaciens]MBT1607961.1 hypothetical protein [Curtobacterium flaccumfaciens pv. betae]MBT1657386.1 hypothetical protein [Curtobacterium flaccumfaciens pv. betae]MCS5465618.1 hypothetical protein [Curtobacterium flaccumfaciens pv. betae]MCX2873679.1 hypothetical protein [Curtobacterium flaccumfaciens pv. betae]